MIVEDTNIDFGLYKLVYTNAYTTMYIYIHTQKSSLQSMYKESMHKHTLIPINVPQTKGHVG
ncbi:hypothetical protein ACQP3L_34765, partial [Escherichia coli]